MRLSKQAMSKKLGKVLKEEFNNNQAVYAELIGVDRGAVNKVICQQIDIPHTKILRDLGWVKITPDAYIDGPNMSEVENQIYGDVFNVLINDGFTPAQSQEAVTQALRFYKRVARYKKAIKIALEECKKSHKKLKGRCNGKS